MTVAPVVLCSVVVEVEEQRGESDRGAEHDPRGEVPSARALDADRSIAAAARRLPITESPQRADPDQERS